MQLGGVELGTEQCKECLGWASQHSSVFCSPHSPGTFIPSQLCGNFSPARLLGGGVEGKVRGLKSWRTADLDRKLGSWKVSFCEICSLTYPGKVSFHCSIQSLQLLSLFLGHKHCLWGPSDKNKDGKPHVVPYNGRLITSTDCCLYRSFCAVDIRYLSWSLNHLSHTATLQDTPQLGCCFIWHLGQEMQ